MNSSASKLLYWLYIICACAALSAGVALGYSQYLGHINHVFINSFGDFIRWGAYQADVLFKLEATNQDFWVFIMAYAAYLVALGYLIKIAPFMRRVKYARFARWETLRK